MSRTGVTQNDVYEVCKNLLAKDQKITMQRVRDELGGSGSFTTISKYIKSFQKEARGKDLTKTGLSKSISQLIQQLATQLDTEANESIIKIEKQFQAEREAYEAKLTSLKEQLASKATVNNKLDVELKQAKSDLQKTQFLASKQDEAIVSKDLEIKRLEGVVDSKDAIIERLEQSVKQGFENLEDFRQKTKEVTDELKRGHQEEIQKKDIENRKLAIKVTTLQNEVTQLNRQNAELITEKRLSTKAQHDLNDQIKKIKKEHQEALRDNAELTGAMKSKEKELERANKQNDAARNEISDLKIKLSKKNNRKSKSNSN